MSRAPIETPAFAMDEATVAETVARTLDWAAGQAQFPVFRHIVGLDVGEVELTLNGPGEPEHYRLTVERITDRAS